MNKQCSAQPELWHRFVASLRQAPSLRKLVSSPQLSSSGVPFLGALPPWSSLWQSSLHETSSWAWRPPRSASKGSKVRSNGCEEEGGDRKYSRSRSQSRRSMQSHSHRRCSLRSVVSVQEKTHTHTHTHTNTQKENTEKEISQENMFEEPCRCDWQMRNTETALLLWHSKERKDGGRNDNHRCHRERWRPLSRR